MLKRLVWTQQTHHVHLNTSFWNKTKQIQTFYCEKPSSLCTISLNTTTQLSRRWRALATSVIWKVISFSKLMLHTLHNLKTEIFPNIADKLCIRRRWCICVARGTSPEPLAPTFYMHSAEISHLLAGPSFPFAVIVPHFSFCEGLLSTTDQL